MQLDLPSFSIPWVIRTRPQAELWMGICTQPYIHGKYRRQASNKNRQRKQLDLQLGQHS